MSRICISMLLVISICLAVCSTGCVRAEHKSPVDQNQQLVRNTLITWKDAVEKRDVASLGKVISKDYKNARGMNRETYLENVKTGAEEPSIDLTDLKVTINDGKADATGIAVKTADGQKIGLKAMLVKEPDGVWRIVENLAEIAPGM